MKAKKYKTSSLKFEMLSSTEVNIRFISKSGNLEEIEVEKEAILLLSEFFEYGNFQDSCRIELRSQSIT